jgi:hypothetical protein
MADGEGPVTTPEGARIGWTPVPDPTKLTTDAVNLATTQMRRELNTLREILEARIIAGESDSALQLEGLRTVRPEIERSIGHLQDLHDEKFKSVELQFRERDVRAEQAAVASKQALDAALTSAKELVGQQNTANVEAAAKAEASFTKQIDQIAVTISALEKGIGDRITELKERIDRGEGQGQGVKETNETRQAANGQYIAVAAALISFSGIIVAVILAFTIHK